MFTKFRPFQSQCKPSWNVVASASHNTALILGWPRALFNEAENTWRLTGSFCSASKSILHRNRMSGNAVMESLQWKIWIINSMFVVGGILSSTRSLSSSLGARTVSVRTTGISRYSSFHTLSTLPYFHELLTWEQSSVCSTASSMYPLKRRRLLLHLVQIHRVFSWSHRRRLRRKHRQWDRRPGRSKSWIKNE